jgi:hypothetical protein
MHLLAEGKANHACGGIRAALGSGIVRPVNPEGVAPSTPIESKRPGTQQPR